MDRLELVQTLWRELAPHLAEQGYELIELELAGQGGNTVLRVFLDKEGGITLDDCTAASQLLSPLLDAGDYIDSRYMLEVSSPGIDRPLRRPADFQRFAGEPVKVRTLAPVEGRKRFRGVLQGFADGLITVECDGKDYEIHIENLHKANLDR